MVMIISSFQSSSDHFPFLDSYAETISLNIKTDKAFYEIGDAVEISGSAINPSTDVLTLKIFDSDANVVLESQIELDEENSFLTKILLSDPMWEDSKFYVATVKMNDEVAATSFELKSPSEEKQETPFIAEPVVTKEPDEKTSQLPQKLVDYFYQNPVFVFIVVIIVAGIVIWVAYSKKLPSLESIKHKPQPFITFVNPALAQIHLKDGTRISYESWESIPIDKRRDVATVEFWVLIRNNGGGVATNISSTFLKKDDIFSRQDLMKKEMKPLPSLAPGGFYYQDFEIPWDRFVKLREYNIFVGLLISYTKQQTKSYSGIIFGIGMGSNYIMDEWFT